MGRYLVTGVAGFIASKVAEILLTEGQTVVGVDNLNNAYDVRLKHWRLDRISNHSGMQFFRLDVCNRKALHELLAEQATRWGAFDAVINLAARAGVRQSLADPWGYLDTNTTGTLNLLELCREFGIPKFVQASSSSLYGKGGVMPYQEDADTDRPLSPYAASKKAAEALCYTYNHLYHVDITIFRYFTVYGPAGRPDMIPFRLVQWISEGWPVRIYGDGQQSRDFTYVDDVARGTIAGLKRVGCEIINLGSDRPVVLLDAVRLVERLVGQRAQLQFSPTHAADVRITWADISRARERLGWRPSIDFEAGVGELVTWYQENRSWAREIETGDL